MFRRSFLFMYMVLILLIPSISFSQTEEIKDYKVNAGDTLWNISGKELGDPFLWPKVWQENPEIANPDKIYPGQKIRIPLRYAQKEEQEKQAASAEPSRAESQKVKTDGGGGKPSPASVKLQPLVNRSILVSSGYIADSISAAGKIDGAPDRILFGTSDIVYVNMEKPVKAGERFYIIRNGGMIEHPVTKRRIGYLVEMVGVIEILRFENSDVLANITEMFNDIHSGDLLLPYYEIPSPLTSGEFRKPEVTGYVIASRYGHLGNAKLNIVYVDRGFKDGLDVGDIIKTVKIIDNHKVSTGAIQLISCQNTTSTAIVLKNDLGEILVGNLIMKLD